MRRTDRIVTRISLAATAVVAGLLGVTSVSWSPAAAGDAASGVLPVTFEETMIITAPVDDVVLEMAPTRDAYLLGEPIAFTARLTNVGDTVIIAPDGGVQDLAVQRVANADPKSVGDVTFLALMDGTASPFELAPGESKLTTIAVGAGEPFDRPGLHRVTGQWQIGGRTVRVPPFDVVIEAALPIASKTTAAQRSGA